MKASQKAIDHAALLFAVIEIEAPRLVLSKQFWTGDALKARAQNGEQPGATIFRFNNPNAPASAANVPGGESQ